VGGILCKRKVKFLFIFLSLSLLTIFGCNGKTAQAEFSNLILSKEGKITIKEIEYVFINITYSEEKEFSNIIGVMAFVMNNGNTSVRASSQAYLIDTEGNQYDVDLDATYQVQKSLDAERDPKIEEEIYEYMEDGINGYELHPFLPKVIVWGFEVPKRNQQYFFYHKPLSDYPAFFRL